MFNYVSLALLAITAIIVLINLLKGLIRGFKKSIGSLIAIILSAITAAIITSIICNPGSEMIVSLIEIVKNLLGQGDLEDILAISELGESIAYYIAMILAPFIFFVLYSVLSIIIAIIVGIIVRFIPLSDLRKEEKKEEKKESEENTSEETDPEKKNALKKQQKQKKKQEKKSRKKRKGPLYRLGGLGVGAVCGLLVSALLLMPVVGVMNILIRIEESGAFDSEDGSDGELSEFLDGASEDKLYAVYSVSSGWMFDSLASVRYDGEKIYLKDDIEVIMIVIQNLSALSGDMTELGDDQINALNAVVDSLDRAPLLKNTLAGFLSEMASKWIAGESFLGIEAMDAGELLNPLIHSVFDVMSTSTKDTITDDMRTLINIIDVLVDYKLLDNVDDFEKILEILSEVPEEDGEEGESAIEALINVANANPRMKKLSDEITMLSIRALASTLGIPEDDDELYNGLMDDIAAALNESNYADDKDAYVEEKVIEALDNYGVHVGGDAAAQISDSLIEDFGDKGNVDGTAIKEFFMLYAAASSGSDNEGDLYLGFDRLSASDSKITTNPITGELKMGDYVFKYYYSDSYDESAAYSAGKSGIDFEDAASLSSADEMKTSMVTLADIFGAEGMMKFSELTQEESNREADMISEMLSLAGDMFDGNFSNPDYRALVKKMGGVLDKMSEMKIFGMDATAKLLEAIFQSEQVHDALGLPSHELDGHVHNIIETAKKEGNNYTNVTKSIGSMLDMMDCVNNKNATVEERIATTRELMENLTPENAELLGSMATPEMVKGYVKNEEKAETVSNSISSLFNNMAQLDTDDKEVYDKEAEAVNTMLNLAMEGSSSDEKALFTEFDENGNIVTEGKVDTDAAGFVDLVANSSVVSKTVNDTVAEDSDNPYGVNPSGEDEAILTEAIVNHYNETKGDLDADEREDLKFTLENLAVLSNIPVPELD